MSRLINPMTIPCSSCGAVHSSSGCRGYDVDPIERRIKAAIPRAMRAITENGHLHPDFWGVSPSKHLSHGRPNVDNPELFHSKIKRHVASFKAMEDYNKEIGDPDEFARSYSLSADILCALAEGKCPANKWDILSHFWEILGGEPS